MASFDPYPWQLAEMQRMHQVIEQQRLPHALLFSGPEGIGKRHFASCLAHDLFSRHSRADNFHSLLKAGSHPDLQYVTLLEDKHQISVEQIRDLSQTIALTPQVSDIKVAIIEPAEQMTVAAANALLKTLEEPAGHTHIMLLSHNAGRLVQTIRSRCQHHALGLPNQQLAAEWLQSSGVNNAADYLMLTGGAPLMAVNAAEHGWLESNQNLMNDLSLLMNDNSDFLAVAGNWRNIELSLLISWIQKLVHSLIKARLDPEFTSAIPGNFLNNLKISMDRLDSKKLIEYAEYLDKAVLEIRNNLNRELFLEQILIRWLSLAA